MICNMIGGTQVLTSSDTNQKLALMVSNHTHCIGMELKVKKNEFFQVPNV